MRFPSLRSLTGEAGRTFRRFPIAILLAAKATGLGIWWTHLEDTYAHKYIDVGERSSPEQWYWNAIVSCYLGMLLSVAVTKWVEKRGARMGGGGVGGMVGEVGSGGMGGGRGMAIGLQAVVVVLAGLYYWSLPSEANAIMAIRTIVLALGLHWLIAVIGFGGNEVNGFWVFNKRLFLRVLTTFLYTMVLYIGVALALLAIDKLFSADVHSEVYEECWWVLGGLFSVWFFLAGFPGSYENPTVISDYPKGLKIFTQYVLLTLVTIYMLILYAYMFKIILTRHWPVGWVAWLVLAFAVAGILSLLLIYPLQNDDRNVWVRYYTRTFYQALLPLTIMLFTAIYKRVEPYGITEQRYFLLALACWLVFIIVYFLISRKKDIRLVPLSLCVLAFLSVLGPWGAFSVSLNSQRGRLKELLVKNGLMVNGRVVADVKGVVNGTGAHVSGKDRKAISSVTDYIEEIHGYRALQPLFVSNLDSLIRRDSIANGWQRSQRAEMIVHLMHVEYVNSWQTVEDSVKVNGQMVVAPVDLEISTNVENEAIATEGAQYVVPFTVWATDHTCDSTQVGDGFVKICADSSGRSLTVRWEPGGAAIVDLGPLAGWAESKSNLSYGASQSEVTVYYNGGSLVGKVVFKHLRGTRSEGKVRFNTYTGTLLVSKK